MPGSGFDDVYLVNPVRLKPAPAEQVVALEAELGARLPAGYADYVQRLGEGSLGHFVRVLGPTGVAEATRDWRERVSEYWFWDTGDIGVEAEALQERGVLVGSSFDGDELCFDPADPDTLLVLPRNDDVALPRGPGLVAALDWLLSGELNPWVEGWTFEAWSHRADVSRSLDPERTLDDVVARVEALGEHTHAVTLEGRTTFFLPAIGGRLSLHQFDGRSVGLELSHDEDADPQAVDGILAALG